MRVGELIQHLQQLPADAKVYVDDDEFPEVVEVISDNRPGEDFTPPLYAVLLGVRTHDDQNESKNDQAWDDWRKYRR